ncbi:LysR family transcriptional regulator [Aquabacterium sp. OR-4]|uniref:LysR family transcriptional regulator n=1 Tax=Aquabacterium sp. OR-4 TaxID=2978127 RepID=UPI0021B32A58|nr:LysR family transcriptional regulator [Aquabacterium sp. OR-4]MDT7837012.1 LysR family transcriptional regulator [Aquabacterium sp. OR-4]
MRLGHFDLNLFITLDALLETASVSRAAERLHLGASATSSALGRLRAHFQDELLVPAGRGMHLTPLAQSLREPVRELLLRAQATLASGSAVEPAALRRRFVINASDYATTVLLTPLSQRLEALAPGVSIDVVSLGNSNVERLERGDVDLAIYPERNASPDHPQCELLTERYSCVVWTGFHLQGEALGLPQYLAARHVAAQFGDLRVPTFESWFLATHQAQREVVASASSFNALPLLVVGTQRIATMHTRLARMYARLLPVRLLAPPFEIPPLTLVAQWNRLKAQDAALAWLREQLQAVALQA